MLKFFCDKTATLQRPTYTKDAIGGAVQTWATVSTWQCALWPKKRHGIDQAHRRDDWVGEFLAAGHIDPAAEPGDRLLIDSKYYFVVSSSTFGNSNVSAHTVYQLDLVLRLPGNATWAIEIKRTTTPKVSRGFHLSVDDIKADRKILVYAGEREVPAGDGLRAMPLATAVEQLRNL